MADGVDTGNPNFFTTFKGKYSLEPNENVELAETVMLSCTNDVIFTGNATFVEAVEEGASLVCALPGECHPSSVVRVPVCFLGGKSEMAMLQIDANGLVWLMRNVAAGDTLFLNGVSFNISGNWY